MPGQRITIFASLFVLALFAGPAWASSALPSLALDPPASPTSPSIWSGLYVGSGLFAVAGNGAKGHVGGEGEIGYEHEFDNRLVLGIDARGGYSPGLLSNSPVTGFDFGATDIRMGYDMGRWMPYIETGVVLAKPAFGPQSNYISASQSADDLLSGPGHVTAAPRIGAGVDYAVTPNLHLDVNVSGGRGNALGDPFGP